jgi:hypothetical protein
MGDVTESETNTIESDSERFKAVRDLGHSASELVQSRYVIWVEGPSDRVFLNFWIQSVAPELIEGADYTIVFYGGKILSHHSFEDAADDLVKALSLSRNFAVILDSDIAAPGAELRSTKLRVIAEANENGGLAWVTAGREIENYVPKNVQNELAAEQKGVTVRPNKFHKVLNEKGSKIAFARAAVEKNWDHWPLDLTARINDLVAAIKDAA